MRLNCNTSIRFRVAALYVGNVVRNIKWLAVVRLRLDQVGKGAVSLAVVGNEVLWGRLLADSVQAEFCPGAVVDAISIDVTSSVVQ